MKKTASFLAFGLLAGILPAQAFAATARPTRAVGLLAPGRSLNASPAAAGQASVWKSQDEYNAYMAIANEKDAQKKVALADAFLAKFTDSAPVVKGYVYTQVMTAAQQLNDSAKAIDAAKKIVELQPDNLAALQYLSYAFPFTFKPGGADETAQLSRAESDAKHGLDLLSKLQKPANVTDDQFQQAIKSYRATFNSAVGFVALQRKDYAAAVTSLKAAVEDNPNDLYSTNFLGTAYIYSKPPDYNNGLWYLARAVALAKAAKGSDTSGIEKYYHQAYCGYHLTQDGMDDIVTQAAASPAPPANFEVTRAKPPAPTQNPNLDAFNSSLKFPLSQCEDNAASAWSQLKDKPLQSGGFVNSVEKGSDENSFLIKISLDQSKADKSYDIVLQDSSQPKVADLSQGDAVHFQGTISAYTATPSFSLTLSNAKINDDDLEADTAKEKNKPHRRK